MSSKLFLGAALALFLGLSTWELFEESPTVDEFKHVPAGLYHLRTGDPSIDLKTPPLSKLAMGLFASAAGPQVPPRPPSRETPIDAPPETENVRSDSWAPWRYGMAFEALNGTRYDGIFHAARAPGVLAGMCLIVLLYRFSRALHGPRGALLTAGLAATCPTLLGHAHLAGTDVPLTLFFVLTVFAVRQFFETGRLEWAAAAGMAAGAALGTKFTGALAFLLAPVLLAFAAGWGPAGCIRCFRCRLPLRSADARAGAAAGALFLFLLFGLVVVNGLYLFRDTGRSLRSLPLLSDSLTRMARGPLGSIPLPIPAALLRGLDFQTADLEMGDFPNYLDGQWRWGSQPGYFFWTLLYKVPVATWPLILWGLWRSLRDPRARWPSVFFLLLPAAAVVHLAGGPNAMDIGIRYVLPALALSYVVAGGALREGPAEIHSPIPGVSAAAQGGGSTPAGPSRVSAAGTLPWLLLAGSAFSSLLAAPCHLAYFNFLAGGPGNGPRRLLDSNIDWGQDLKRLGRFVRDRKIPEIHLAYFGHVDPRIYGIRWRPLRANRPSGWIAVSVNYLYGYPYPFVNETGPPEQVPTAENRPELLWYAWLRDKTPEARIGWSIYVYHIPGP